LLGLRNKTQVRRRKKETQYL
jgi:hypothetical protein